MTPVDIVPTIATLMAPEPIPLLFHSSFLAR
jgi:hypothetical protein